MTSTDSTVFGAGDTTKIGGDLTYGVGAKIRYGSGVVFYFLCGVTHTVTTNGIALPTIISCGPIIIDGVSYPYYPYYGYVGGLSNISITTNNREGL